MMKNTLILIAMVLLFSCTKPTSQPVLVDEASFKTEHDGKTMELFTLKNANGLVAQITNYGGKVINLWTPDKNGDFADIVIGYETSAEYLNTTEIYYGTLIGRYGNRIANGQFTLNDSVYTLAKNNGENHLHGGIKGFNNVVWDAKKLDDQTLELTYLSVDGEEGYPGNLNVKVVYKLTDENELKVEYWATTDKPTPINLTQHSFFNLKGAGNGDVNDHIMQIMADAFTPVDSTLIPTGEIAPVDGTPFDFRTPTVIGDRINDEHIQMKYGNGYDHNWVLNKAESGLSYAAKVVEPASGRTLEVYTNEPGIQFYGGNFMTGNDTGKGGKVFAFRGAFCLETQHFPDSPNKPQFPSTILNPGMEYYSVCVYKFGVEK
jgi:aldose 1-epimerase